MQLGFYHRVLHLSDDRWVKKNAMNDHLSMSWHSPYIDYVYSIRMKLKLHTLPLCKKTLLMHLNTYFINEANETLASLSIKYIQPIKTFKRMRYAMEGAACQFLANCRLNAVNLGNLFPRDGMPSKQKICPLCKS